MNTEILQSDLFKGTASYYARYRPDLPVEVITHLQQRFNLKRTGTLLDMGCGTGQSTFALAPFFEKTIAFDTDLDMLFEAKKIQPKNLDITWQNRSDKDISDSEGPYKLVTACRSFNWMDQYPLLKKLHYIIEPGGGIALIGDGSFWTGPEPWQHCIKETIQSFLGKERRAGQKIYSSPDEPYIRMLEKNNYLDPHIETIFVAREWDIDRIIGYLYSTSFSARHLFEDRVDAFENTLKSNLMQANNGQDRFIEYAAFTVQSAFTKG